MPNRLANSTSPYLLQHKDNPVDWWEWSDEAFAEAARRDVPVLLSVGYSACHWCHVMAHESFEDEKTAAAMNRLFVNVKVDREERPDVDSIYMEAVQAMTGRGGWPMTVWMTPDRRPFYAGTYFPKEPHQGMASFGQVIEAIADAWETKREGVVGQADQLVAAISGEIPEGQALGREELAAAVETLLRQHDATFGGFGGAPKFPQQPVLEFLLRWHTVDPKTGQALSQTLHRMADGGIHDHLGGGFARYAVDRKWLVPHFEKMLYDNAQLARIYLWAGIERGEDRFVDVARSTLEYMLRDLRHESGGFFAAEDADSEGEEGKFYVWYIAETREVLGEDAEAFIDYFGMTGEGNFEGENILHLTPASSKPPGLEAMRSQMLERRSTRVRPGLDDKVIAGWNGLAIRAFAEAGAALGEQRFVHAAVTAADFVLDHLMPEGRLTRSWRDGATSVSGFLDDHAGMALGLLALYAATGTIRYFEVASSLVDEFAGFETEGRLYTTTSSDGLIKRPRDITDNPLPSGNAMAAEAMLLMSLLTGDSTLRSRADRALGAPGEISSRYPSMVAHHLAVMASLVTGTKELAVVGDERDALLSEYWSAFRPHVALAQADSGTDRVPLLAGRTVIDGRAAAYVCQDFVCELPTSSPDHLRDLLSASPTS